MRFNKIALAAARILLGSPERAAEAMQLQKQVSRYRGMVKLTFQISRRDALLRISARSGDIEIGVGDASHDRHSP